MTKPLFFLHLGPESVDASAMRDDLARGGVSLPTLDETLLPHADLEIRRAHKDSGLKRKHVEGSWAKVTRAARRTRSHCFVSVPGFFDAEEDQAALAVDGLLGFRVVVILTSGFDAEIPTAWASRVRAERIHVLPATLSSGQLAAQVARIALMEDEARLVKRLAKAARRGNRRNPPGRRIAA